MSSFTSPPKRRAMELTEIGGSTSPEPDAKRRKLRKGTTSCWDCKKRKVRCTFDETSNTVCISCRRRGAPCIGQDKPEDEIEAYTKASRDALLDRMQKVETLLEKIVDGSHDPGKDGISLGFNSSAHKAEFDYLTPSSNEQSRPSYDPPPSRNTTLDARLCLTDDLTRISEELVKAFPSQADIDILCKSDYVATFYCHQMFTKCGPPENQVIEFVNNIAKIPNPSTTSPVSVAKRMIIFASFLQYFRALGNHGLSEHPTVIMDRLVNTAVRLVTTNENIVCCMEGLESIILEGVYQSNGGNVRRGWLAFRKAMVIAQLLRIDVPNPPLVETGEANCKIDPRWYWFRIVYMDSYLSLMLGLPHGGHETHMENDIPGETPTCKLERAHTLIARRIIDRNRRNAQDLAVTKKLDQDLQTAARDLPDEFWFQPTYSNLRHNTPEAFWDTMRLADHLHHYNLLHLLHLPYLLRDDKESSSYAYSKTTCVHASREILYRVIAFHDSHSDWIALPCRTADFFALMAGMTVLLAHIDGNRLEEKDWRAHQRLSDRSIVQQLLNLLEKEGKHTHNSLTVGSAKTIHCLLDIESDTARGMGTSAADTVSCIEEHWSELRLSIPYLGIIKIGRKGITKDWPAPVNAILPLQNDMHNSVHAANHILSAAGFGEALQQGQHTGFFPEAPDMRPVPALPVDSIGPDTSGEVDQRRPEYPGLMASVNDWAFQGVDGVFFDSIMQGAADWEQSLQGNTI